MARESLISGNIFRVKLLPNFTGVLGPSHFGTSLSFAKATLEGGKFLDIPRYLLQYPEGNSPVTATGHKKQRLRDAGEGVHRIGKKGDSEGAQTMSAVFSNPTSENIFQRYTGKNTSW